MKKIIIFNSRDGLLRLEVDKIVYFEADGNYTRVVTKNKLKATLTMGLARTEQELTGQLENQAVMFMRVGKRFIVNREFIYCVNLAKQHLVLSDMEDFAFQLPISKEALKKMKELIVLSNQ
mgnify:CR=1 FL=1